MHTYDVQKVQGMALVRTTSKEVSALKRVLTLTSNGDASFTLYLYREAPKGSLWVPRAMISGTDRLRVDGEWEPLKFTLKPTLWGYQEKMVSAFMEALKSEAPYGGIIKAATGSGKTIVALEIARRIGLKTLVVVPLDPLMQQWTFENIYKKTNLRKQDIGIIRQDDCQVKGKKVVVAMIHSLTQREYPKFIYDDFGLVIYDEVSRVGAETFSRTASMFNCKYRIGLSATPRRRDGMEKVFLWHIGPVTVNYNKPTLKPKVVMVSYPGNDAGHGGCMYQGKFLTGRYLNRLQKAMPRTGFIADLVYQLYIHKRKDDILVLSDRVKILDDLFQILLDKKIPKGDLGIFTSKKKQGDRRVLLATYGSAGMGIDMPRLSALVLATRSEERRVGKECRSRWSPYH